MAVEARSKGSWYEILTLPYGLRVGVLTPEIDGMRLGV